MVKIDTLYKTACAIYWICPIMSFKVLLSNIRGTFFTDVFSVFNE